MAQTTLDERISRRVIESRIRNGEIAAALGMPKASVSDRLHGRTRWTVAELPALAALVGVSIDDLIGGDQ